MSTKSILCRYHMYGYCNLGSRCLFSHDRSSEPSQICRYYLNGKCPFEKKCRYDHIKPSLLTNPSSTLHLDCTNTDLSCEIDSKQKNSLYLKNDSNMVNTSPSTSGNIQKITNLENEVKQNCNYPSSAKNLTDKDFSSQLPTSPYHSCHNVFTSTYQNTDTDQIPSIFPASLSESFNSKPTLMQQKYSIPKTNPNVQYLNLKPLFFKESQTSMENFNAENCCTSSELKPVLGYKPPSLLNLFTSNSEEVESHVATNSVSTTTDLSDTIKSYVFNVGAKEFFPLAPKSYSDAVVQNLAPLGDDVALPNDMRPLCPYSTEGVCWYGQEQCMYLHGETCDICEKNMLHPFDMKQQQTHREQCMKEIQLEMEFSFAVQRSEEKTCGICLEKVLDKGTCDAPTSNRDGDSPITTLSPMSQSTGGHDKRFGILPNCVHCYCLPCIMNWRKSKNETLDNNIIRSCPECRVQSYFIIPSNIWVEDKAEKAKMIEEYKKSLSDKPCKYFRKGAGECPLNDICFYKHDYPDGTLALRHVGGPGRGRRRHPHGRRHPLYIRGGTRGGSGSSSYGGGGSGASAFAAELLLWDFFAARFDSIEFLGENFDLLTLGGTDDDDDLTDDDGDFDDDDLFADLDLSDNASEEPTGVAAAPPTTTGSRSSPGRTTRGGGRVRGGGRPTPAPASHRTQSSSSSGGTRGGARRNAPASLPPQRGRRNRGLTYYARQWEPYF